MRKTPLLIFLLCVLFSSRVCADDAAAMSASTMGTGTTFEVVAEESVIGGSAVELSRTTADTFDYSYFLVMALGLAGLFWIRRQSQTL